MKDAGTAGATETRTVEVMCRDARPTISGSLTTASAVKEREREKKKKTPSRR
jgi:hypothetical protein